MRTWWFVWVGFSIFINAFLIPCNIKRGDWMWVGIEVVLLIVAGWFFITTKRRKW